MHHTELNNLPLGAAAARYASLYQWPVFPCVEEGKTPKVAGGFHEATTDAEQITRWWSMWPDANIGFSPGSAGFLVVDCDQYKENFDSDDPIVRSSPVRVLTPSGGVHNYWLLPPDTTIPDRVAYRPGVDLRSATGYVVLPPSRLVHGGYLWAPEGENGHRS